MSLLHAPTSAAFAPANVRRLAKAALRRLASRPAGDSIAASSSAAEQTLAESQATAPTPLERKADVSAGVAQPPIIFIHIPKTAGTAFSYYLKSNCGAPDRIVEAFYGDYSIYEGVENASLILGHTIYREMAARFPQASFVTWLRHPLKRVVSQYKSWHNPNNLHEHWKSNSRRGFEHIYFTQNASFEEFALSEDICLLNNIVNVQTGVLSSLGKPHHRSRVLESAKENLERRFRFFGIVEEFDASIQLFRSEFDWKAEFKDLEISANRSKRQEIRPSDRAIARIMQRNDLDMELYEFACTLLNRRLADLKRTPKPESVPSTHRAA
jgi:hypothetical protein